MSVRIILLIVLVIGTLFDLYIYRELKRFKTRIPCHIHIGVSGLILLAILTVIVLPWNSFTERGMQMIMQLLFLICTFFVSKMLFVAVSLSCKLLKLVLGIAQNNDRIKKISNYTIKTFTSVGAILGIVTFCSMWWGALVTVWTPETKEITVECEHLPKSFDGFKIVHISDFHVGSLNGNTKFVSDVVETINSLSPDVILFTGDLVNSRADEVNPYKNELSKLQAKYGVYSVLGNHDYGDYYKWSSEEEKIENLRTLKKLQAECRWKMLNNEHESITTGNDSIVLIGVENWGDFPFPKYGKLVDAYPALSDSCYKILMSHNPVHWKGEVLKSSNIDLMLAGHTHAMQVAINLFGYEWSPAKYRYEEWGGLYSSGNRLLYVNRGLGFVGVPMRIGANPEITLITLKKISHDSK